MKSLRSARTTAAALISVLAIPVWLGAQDGAQHHSPKHHHYKLVEMGTFGGPTSSIDATGVPPSSMFNQILTRRGAMLAGADTPIPDPDEFAGPFVNYAFRWKNGVQSNLGVLPEHARVGAQAPCFNCPWSSFAFWMADNGFVVGQSTHNAIDPLTNAPASLAVLWRDLEIVNLGTLGGYESAAASVNARGDVVGVALNAAPETLAFRAPYSNFFIYGYGTRPHAFLWSDGTMRDLGTLGGADSAALFVNDRGQVAGTSDVDSIRNPVTGLPTVHPFVWERGRMHDLIADAPRGMFGGTYGIAAWINERGQVLGTMNLAGDTTWRSFVWERGVVTDLGTLGGIITTAQWMNEAGHVVGKSDVTAICTACPANNQKQLHHPFLWKDGRMIDLGLLDGDTAGAAYSVNERDQVVGVTNVCTRVHAGDGCDAASYNAFLWERGAMVDLQTLVVPGSGITLSNSSGRGAYNINDRGEIAGEGVLPNGDARAVLMIPCDEQHPGIRGCDYTLVDSPDRQSGGSGHGEPAFLDRAAEPQRPQTRTSPTPRCSKRWSGCAAR
jgi:probable HAF family extracellular repeat protein